MSLDKTLIGALNLLSEQVAFVEQHLGVISGVLGSLEPLQIDDIAARLHLLIAERDAELAQAREVLREAEWVFIGTRTVCPACGESVYAGHAPDCKLNAALAAKGD